MMRSPCFRKPSSSLRDSTLQKIHIRAIEGVLLKSVNLNELIAELRSSILYENPEMWLKGIGGGEARVVSQTPLIC